MRGAPNDADHSPAPAAPGEKLAKGRELFLVGLFAAAVTWWFWPALWSGGGFIGNDTYYYYFPQKVFYAEQLRQGRLPLWNPYVGYGYPQLAESQTGALYPVNLLLYRVLAVNTAYNVSQILHYVACCIGAWLLGRVQGLSRAAALVAATIFTWGWFPARVGLEWAIVTGAWMPWILCLTELWWRSGRRAYVLGAATAIGMQLLAGHFHLAFMTLVAVAASLAARLPDVVRGRIPRGRAAGLVLGILAGFSLAAVQVLPTAELTGHSQRAHVGKDLRLDYGRIPWWYYPQIVAPWAYYGADLDFNQGIAADAGLTNKTEAHLYFSLTGLLLCAAAVVRGATKIRTDRPGTAAEAERETRRTAWIWFGLGLLGLLISTGALAAVMAWLPGFRFFQGTGRYGLLTTWAVAWGAGRGGQALAGTTAHPQRKRYSHAVIYAAVLAAIVVDLRLVAGAVTRNVVTTVSDPPLAHRDESPVRQRLRGLVPPPRLFCRGPNLPTVLEVAATPVYLGLAPAAYFDDALDCPQPYPYEDSIRADQLEWLRRVGVTHILSFVPVRRSVWPVRELWSGLDPVLNRAWAHAEPLRLYELQGARGRASWLSGDDPTPQITVYRPTEVEITAESERGGPLILRDLDYPGWRATIDGAPVATRVVDGMFRGIDVPAGRHVVRWEYRPWTVAWGAGMSLATACGLVAAAVGSALRRHRVSAPAAPPSV